MTKQILSKLALPHRTFILQDCYITLKNIISPTYHSGPSGILPGHMHVRNFDEHIKALLTPFRTHNNFALMNDMNDMKDLMTIYLPVIQTLAMQLISLNLL